MSQKLSKPNLFLVGAMKSGSSSLTHYLHAHPDIFMSMRPKEPSYFIDRATLKEIYPAMEQLGIWKSEAHYLKLYEGAADATYAGDASQNYARLPLVTGVPQRIARFCPNPKILYVVRDPIDRTISHYWYMVRNFGESRPMLEAIKSSKDYTDTSYYAMQLEPYLRLFGANNVKVVISEELRQAPGRVMRDIFSWLEVEDTVALPTHQISANPTPMVIRQAQGSGLLFRLRFSKAWSMIGRFTPERIRRIGASLSEREVDRSTVPIEEVESYLHDIQKTQIDELAALTGLSYKAWTRFG